MAIYLLLQIYKNSTESCMHLLCVQVKQCMNYKILKTQPYLIKTVTVQQKCHCCVMGKTVLECLDKFKGLQNNYRGWWALVRARPPIAQVEATTMETATRLKFICWNVSKWMINIIKLTEGITRNEWTIWKWYKKLKNIYQFFQVIFMTLFPGSWRKKYFPEISRYNGYNNIASWPTQLEDSSNNSYTWTQVLIQ